MKTVAQFSAMRKGALDMTLYPLSYAGGEVREIQHRPDAGAWSARYEQAYAWKNAEVGKRLTALMAEKGVVLVSWIWQAGGVGQPHAMPPGARRRQGPEGARRQPRDGPDAEGRRRRR